jgi:hypothetical protein
MANKNPTLDVLQKAVKGLRYTSETDAPLEAFVWGEERSLTKKMILDLVGVEQNTAIETETLEDFFHAVPPEDKAKFDELAKTLQEQLSSIKVYKIGDEAEKQAYIVGKTAGGQWAGLKTTVVET